jgi:hypothetical protein
MARPPLGRKAKNVTGTTRLSEVEVDWLKERYGSVGRGLRAALDGLIALEAPPTKAAPVEDGAAATGKHYCRTWIDEEKAFSHGQLVTLSKTCAECGRVVKSGSV